jgi:hypothetical protein
LNFHWRERLDFGLTFLVHYNYSSC